MPPHSAARARLEELTHEVARKTLDGTLTNKRMDQIEAESERLETQIRNHRKGASMASYASPAEWDGSSNPGAFSDGTTGGGPDLAFRGFGPGMENRIRPTSLYEMDRTQVKALQQAAQQGTGFKVQVGSKGIEHGNFMGGVRSKAAVTEGGLTPNLLPPLQVYGDRGFFQLPYELTRVANFILNVPMTGPGIAYFRHDSNGAEAAYVAEGATKPDLTPVVTEQYVKPAKAAGRINLTHELVQDAGDEFTSRLVTDLARSLYNTESNLLLNGTTGANGFNGINQVSGALTQAIGSDSPLDCISKAMVALRNDFFEPDVCFIHPSTMGALRRIKDSQNRYLLDLMSGPRGIDQTSETENLWGVNVVQTTQQAAGTAAILSLQSGAAVVYVRESLTTFYDPYSQAASNIYQFIAETRLALATPRPSAIALCSGLPTS
jgi:HK97 family phage major capsid protein